MIHKQLIAVALAAVLAFGSAASVAVAYAGSDDHAQEITALRNAKISLGQAVAAAEQKSGGKAINAGLNNENGIMTYGIEVVKDNAVQTVLVDLNSGEVLKVAPADREPENNTEQNGQETGD